MFQRRMDHSSTYRKYAEKKDDKNKILLLQMKVFWLYNCLKSFNSLIGSMLEFLARVGTCVNLVNQSINIAYMTKAFKKLSKR